MTFQYGQILDLSKIQRWVYIYCRDYVGQRGTAPVFAEVRQAAVWWRRIYLRAAIERLVAKKYLRLGVHGALVALNPPHDRLIVEYCESAGVSLDEIREPGRSTVIVVRARRLLVKRLNAELGYTAKAAGEIVNRCPQIVQEYLRADARRKRNARRAAALRAQRSSLHEART